VDHEIKEIPRRQKRDTIRGWPLVFIDSEIRKVWRLPTQKNEIT
jgi:hypothetical protein